MPMTSDIGELFQAMRIAYGAQWKHGVEAIEPWRRALHGSSSDDIRQAAERARKQYPNHPPSMQQFVQIAQGTAPRPSTYLPAPPANPLETKAKRILFAIVRSYNPDAATLRTMVALKNALIEDHGDAPLDVRFLDDLHRELTALARNADPEARDAELQRARETFRRRQGIPA